MPGPTKGRLTAHAAKHRIRDMAIMRVSARPAFARPAFAQPAFAQPACARPAFALTRRTPPAAPPAGQVPTSSFLWPQISRGSPAGTGAEPSDTVGDLPDALRRFRLLLQRAF